MVRARLENTSEGEKGGRKWEKMGQTHLCAGVGGDAVPGVGPFLNQRMASALSTGTPRPSRYNTPILNMASALPKDADRRNQLMASK